MRDTGSTEWSTGWGWDILPGWRPVLLLHLPGWGPVLLLHLPGWRPVLLLQPQGDLVLLTAEVRDPCGRDALLILTGHGETSQGSHYNSLR